MQKHPLRRWIERFVPRPPSPLKRAGIEPGMYHYQRESGGGTFTRFHLRIERSGAGLLLANATAAARLHPSGTIIAKGLLDREPLAVIVARLEHAFVGLAAGQVAEDVAAVRRIIETLDTPGDNYPILNLDDPRFSSKGDLLERPLSADVALADPERLVPILDRLWALAIPHVTIVAGPQANAAWLVRAVERAEDLGMIAGVRGRATDLAPGSLVADLARAGVDHVNVFYLAAKQAVHDALAGPGDHAQATALFGRIAASEVCPVAEVPLVTSTLSEIDDTLGTLGRLGVRNVGFFAVATASLAAGEGPLLAAQMAQAARIVEEAAADAAVRFLWYAPVQFTPVRSLGEQLLRGPRCSGDLAIRVEPDGAVLAARGPARAAGNLLTDTWETIQTQPAYADYRRRLLSDTQCDNCPGLAVCAADCPRNPAGWAEVSPA